MGRKWTNIRFTLEDPTKQIRTASASPPTQREKLTQYLTNRWSPEHVNPVKTVDIMFGNYHKKVEPTIKSIFEDIDFVQSAAAVYVTDSAHIGYGWVFHRTNTNNCTLTDEYTGFEGAYGEDVVGEIYDDHKIKLSPEFLW